MPMRAFMSKRRIISIALAGVMVSCSSRWEREDVGEAPTSAVTLDRDVLIARCARRPGRCWGAGVVALSVSRSRSNSRCSRREQSVLRLA